MVASLSRENESAENQTLSNKSKDLSVLTEQLKGSALQALENINFSPIPSIEGGGEQRRISETINGLQVNVIESINNPRYPSLDVEVIDNSLAIDSLSSRSLLLRTNPQGEVNYALPDDDIYSRIGLDKNEFAELVILVQFPGQELARSDFAALDVSPSMKKQICQAHSLLHKKC